MVLSFNGVKSDAPQCEVPTGDPLRLIELARDEALDVHTSACHVLAHPARLDRNIETIGRMLTQVVAVAQRLEAARVQIVDQRDKLAAPGSTSTLPS